MKKKTGAESDKMLFKLIFERSLWVNLAKKNLRGIHLGRGKSKREIFKEKKRPQVFKGQQAPVAGVW